MTNDKGSPNAQDDERAIRPRFGHSDLVIESSFVIRHLSFVLLFFVIMMIGASLKAATPDDTAAITFPPSTAQKWVLPDGLTVIVQEDHSAPVTSVQAWCATG